MALNQTDKQTSQHMYEINNYITAYQGRNFSSVRIKSEVQQISSQLTLAYLMGKTVIILKINFMLPYQISSYPTHDKRQQNIVEPICCKADPGTEMTDFYKRQ